MAGPTHGTTYREAHQTPESYWKSLEPLHERGRRLQAELARALKREGRERAEALAEALSLVNPSFVLRFYADLMAEIRKDDPSDTTGYLAFLDSRRALDDFQAGRDLHTAPIDPAAVDALIARFKLRGESLQEALVLRAAGEILAGQDAKASARSRLWSTRRPRGLDSTAETSSCSMPTRSQRSGGGLRPAKRTEATGSRWITPCTGSSNSTCRTPMKCHAARHSGPASGSAKCSATVMAAP